MAIMRKFLAGIMMCFAAMSTQAGSASHPVTSEPTTVIPIKMAQRVLYFSESRYAITADGQLLVCRQPNKSDWADQSCRNQDNMNAWEYAMGIRIPGYTISGWEIRISGSSTRHLILYYTAV